MHGLQEKEGVCSWVRGRRGRLKRRQPRDRKRKKRRKQAQAKRPRVRIHRDQEWKLTDRTATVYTCSSPEAVGGLVPGEDLLEVLFSC